MQRRIDQQAFAVGIKAGDERTVHDLSGKECPLKRHDDEVAPWFICGIAHANDRATAFPVEGSCDANDEIVIRSEERRVGKECRSRWGQEEYKKRMVRTPYRSCASQGGIE